MKEIEIKDLIQQAQINRRVRLDRNHLTLQAGEDRLEFTVLDSLSTLAGNGDFHLCKEVIIENDFDAGHYIVTIHFLHGLMWVFHCVPKIPIELSDESLESTEYINEGVDDCVVESTD